MDLDGGEPFETISEDVRRESRTGSHFQPVVTEIHLIQNPRNDP
jgi:hypothetical protein